MWEVFQKHFEGGFPLQNDETTYYATTFTAFTARIATLGKVRIVVNFADPRGCGRV